MTKALSLKKRGKVRDYIHEIRGQRVVLDSDLASIYGAPTKVFNQAIQRDLSRFPRDFMFRLTRSGFKILKSQIVTSSSWGGKRKLPLVFTEHGAVMAANLLRSQRAIRMSIEVVRAFIQLRQFALSHVELARKIETLERKYDGQFEVVFDAIRALMDPPEDDPPKKPVGFNTELES